MASRLFAQSATQVGAHIQIRNLHKFYGDVEVLKGIDLDILPGEFVVVVGKSGCGKSTLLRLLSGLDIPTQGEIHSNGVPIDGLNRDARMMFQDARLLPWRRVLGNVTLGTKQQRKRRGHWALQQVGLSDYAQRWVMQLSGGQRQRVALARALVSQPRLLLLDEPLGALDALTRLEMQQLIRTIWQEQGFTVVLVTHDVEEAVYLADRVLVIEDGQLRLNLPINLMHPRSEGLPEFTALKTQILDLILQRHRVLPAHSSRSVTLHPRG